MPGGFLGKVLWVDLSEGKTWEEALPEQMYREYIGGYGLAARMLYERQPAKVDPLGPENILAFACGVLGATGAPGASRWCVAAKSPLTGTWGDASCGGFFGAELKNAGYDAIFVKGAAAKPVYLWVENGKAEIRDAAKAWGLDSNETEDVIHAEVGNKARIACIGQAGEAKSLISCVMHDKGRAAGRSGLGAVMGSKLLKAVAVRGTSKVAVGNAAKVNELRADFNKRLRENPSPQAVTLQKWGTAGNVLPNLTLGSTAPKNWSQGGKESFPEVDLINGDNVTKYQTKRYACYGCPVGCGGVFKVESGPYQVAEAHKPEYETLAGFGTLCLNSNVESIIKCNEICNKAGLDTISASTCVAMAIECYENGLISKEQAGGLELAWGNHQAIVALTELMGKREGLGAIFADGVKVAAERIGKNAAEYAVHIGGQEPGFHDSKLCPSRGTSYVADPTPGRHTTGNASAPEFGRGTSPHPKMNLPKVERYQYAGKGELQAVWANYKQITEASGLCLMTGGMGFPLEEWIAAATGWDFSLDELMLAGERIQQLRHAFNVREGFKPSDFPLPNRMIGKPPVNVGPTAGVTIDIDTLVGEFHDAMGWDRVSGAIAKENLAKVGLAELAADAAQ
ncbi:MAG: aldehyde ferredoxin oxidoreductase family protein [Chloroflexota bacterium]